MTKKYNPKEWLEILDTIGNKEMTIKQASKHYKISQNQIYLKLKEVKQKQKKSFWNKFKELFDGVLWKLP